MNKLHYIGHLLLEALRLVIPFLRKKPALCEPPTPQPEPVEPCEPKPDPVAKGYLWDFSEFVDQGGSLRRPLDNTVVSIGIYTAWGYGDDYEGFEEVMHGINNALGDDHLAPLAFGSSYFVYGTLAQKYGDVTITDLPTGKVTTVPMKLRF